MKRIIPLFFIITLLFPGCQKQQRGEVRFCYSYDLENTCIGETTTFLVRSRFWVVLELNSPSPGETVKGSLYRIGENDRTFILDKKYQLEQGEKKTADALVINQPGRFILEFTDDKGKIIASKELEIL
jgi:hypothetical protein